MSDATDTEVEAESTHSAPKSNRINDAIDRFVHQARDIKWSARVFVPAAAQLTADRIEKAAASLKDAEAQIENPDSARRAQAMKEISDALRTLKRFQSSSVPELLERSLFLNLFAVFDAFIGDLMWSVYLAKPELFGSIEKQIPFTTLIAAKNIDDIKRSVLDDEIEALRRKSYVEQFSLLETKFGLSLRKFSRWADFVECAQRRNLITHCDGIVSEQYLLVCDREGLKPLPAIGARLVLGADYFLDACELLIEVGFKLGQTLWRKVVPSQIQDADRHLIESAYDALKVEAWERASMICEFALGQKNIHREVDKRIIAINHAIAHRAKGDEKKVGEILGAFDWSAALPEFRLAEAVLRGEWVAAAETMRRIGTRGELITQRAYHDWPLFREFRELPEFHQAYSDVYGSQFAIDVQRDADKAVSAMDIANETNAEDAPRQDAQNDDANAAG